jgi:hypothetical protein
MLKRKIRVTIVSLLFCVGWAFAGTIQAPEKTVQSVDQTLATVPLPTVSAAEALDIAKKLKRNPPAGYRWARSDNYSIVAIDWCKSSDFKPRFSDGSNWSVLDDKDAYAWFVTYLEPPQGYPGTRSVSIIRIKDNGKADFMFGTRT